MTTSRVLYLAGWGRSGSTLLARLMSVHPDVVFVGELRDLWHRGVDEDQPCGCGQTFHTCSFWTAVGQAAYGGWDTRDVAAMKELRTAADRPWTPTALARGLVPSSRRAAITAYVEMLGRVLRAITEVSGGRMILDSSKIASFAWLLAEAPDLDLRTVHLVRDSRGVVASWQKSVAKERDRERDGEQPSYMVQYDPVRAVARYDLYNTQAEHLDRLGPLLRVRYEDLVTSPRQSLQAVTDLAGLAPWDLDHVVATDTGTEVTLGPSHSVVGNPMRMQTGAVPLRPDTSWQQALPGPVRRAVTLGTWPLLRRYHYEVNP